MLKPIIYLDMDGVLADFEGWGADVIGPDWKKEIDKPEWGRWTDYPNVYSLLPPMKDAKDLFHGCVDMLGDVNQVQILTALPNRAKSAFPSAARDKIEWAHKHIHPSIRVHFGPHAQDKQYHKKHRHDVLIDDMKRNIDQWNDAGGIGILHTSAISSLIELSIKLK